MEQKPLPLPYFAVYPLEDEKRIMDETMEDRLYFKQLYPENVKHYIAIIVDILDRMDIKESYIYDQYPDKIRMERLTEVVLRQIPMEKNMNRETQRNLIRVLLWDEIIERRKKRII